jgi:predicted transcriptional regulator
MEDTIKVIKNASPLLVRMEPSLKAALDRKAQQEGMSAAAIMRMALRAFLEPPKRAGKK